MLAQRIPPNEHRRGFGRRVQLDVNEFQVDGRRQGRILGLIDSGDPDRHAILVVLGGLLFVLTALTVALAYSIVIQ